MNILSTALLESGGFAFLSTTKKKAIFFICLLCSDTITKIDLSLLKISIIIVKNYAK